MKNENGSITTEAIFGLLLLAWAISSWITHVVTCLNEESWGFLIAGAIMAPIGMIHGTGIWFGWF